MIETHSISIKPFDETIELRLDRKTGLLGTVSVDQWWMPSPTVYPTSKVLPGNYRAVVNGFWQLCRQAGSDRDPAVADSYLLARLLPFVRPLGSRRILADARLGLASKADRNEASELLDSMLRTGDLKPITEVEFRDKTGDEIGPLTVDGERYHHFADMLFSGPRTRLTSDPEAAVAEMRQIWEGWACGFGRRSDREEDKHILDVLSYEARTALHRCYSAVWSMLLPHLLSQFRLSLESYRFLEFWNQEPTRLAEKPAPAYFHLFHAHTFGLHPAGAAFIQTVTGRKLLGEWIQAELNPSLYSRFAARRIGPHLTPEYGRLLHGLLLAVFHYSGRRSDANQLRRGSHSQLPSDMAC